MTVPVSVSGSRFTDYIGGFRKCLNEPKALVQGCPIKAMLPRLYVSKPLPAFEQAHLKTVKP